MTNILTGTGSFTNGSPNFTWVGTALSGAICPNDSQVTVSGVTYFLLSLTDSTHGVLTRNFAETTGSGKTVELNPLTSDQVATATLSSRTQTLISQLSALDAYGRGFKFTYSNGTGMTDPGPGFIAFNNTTLASATGFVVDTLDATSLDISGVVNTWDDSTSLPHGMLVIRSIATQAYAAFLINGAITNPTGYLTCTSLVYAGGAGALVNGEGVMVWAERNGNQAYPGSADIANLGLACSVGAGALTMRLKQQDGATDATAASPVLVGVDATPASSGASNRRSVTGALSLVVPSGATLGQANGVAANLYAYVQDNAGTLELVISGQDYGDSFYASSTTISSGATSSTVLYATTGRASLGMRKIGAMVNTQATAGTWAAVPSSVITAPFGPAFSEYFKTLFLAASAAAARTTLGSTTVGDAVFVAASGAVAQLAIGARERLTTNRTYYVRPDGNDANTGLVNSSGGAFLTLQRAWNVVATLDLSGFTVTIQAAAASLPATFTSGITISSGPAGGGLVDIVGDTTTYSNFVIAPSSQVISVTCPLLSVVRLRGFKVSSSASDVIAVSSPGVVFQYGNLEWAGAPNGFNVNLTTSGSKVSAVGSTQTISGDAVSHFHVTGQGLVADEGQTITYKGAPNFSFAFVIGGSGGVGVYGFQTFVYPTCAIPNASPGVITATAHGLSANHPVCFGTTGALPTGLTAGTTYYVKTVIDANNFTVSATAGGTAINTSSAGSGTHSLRPTGSKYFLSTGGGLATDGGGPGVVPGNVAGTIVDATAWLN